MIGTLPVWDLAPRDYRQALDAAMPLLAGADRPLLRCHLAPLEAEARQRRADWSPAGPAGAVLWVEPLSGDWQQDLAALDAALEGDGPLIVVASRPLARLLPERHALGLQPGGFARLRRALARRGFRLEAEYGFHTLLAIGLNLLAGQAARWGRPDLGDRLHFAARLRYYGAGRLACLSTVALLLARRRGASPPAPRPTPSPAAPRAIREDGAAEIGPSEVGTALARLDAWLETMRSPAGVGYGGPVVHWWRQCLLYTGPGLDWRYEGIIAGYLALWQRTGQDRWLQKACRAGDDLLAGGHGGDHFAASGFEINPAAAGTPHEAAAAAGLLQLALALRAAGREGWPPYAAAACRNLQTYYLDRLWDPEARSFRDSPGVSSFVPNKAATACEAFFLLAELEADARWVETYALPTLDRIVAYQVRDGGPRNGGPRNGGSLDGAIAQNSIGPRRVDKYFPLYIARCVPALLQGGRWPGGERYVDAALRAVAFLARQITPDGTFPTVLYPGRRANHYPAWIAPLGDVLRAADLCRPLGFDADLSALRARLLAGQDASGGIQTASGFAAQAGGRPPALPDLRDLLHVAGWCAMAFRYLAALAGPGPLPSAESAPFEAGCTFRGRTLRLLETADRLEVAEAGRPRYRWRKGVPWAEVAEKEFWLQ